MTKRTWSDLSAGARAATVLAGAVHLTLLAAAQADLVRRSDAEVRGAKWIWRLVCLVNFAGPITYFALGRRVPPWRA